ncbi:MAG: exo-alpha-sialidase [Planctomycetota bacterium]|nr:MAG: exo-alpha-sialidase [Planctomycetota bacterium]
MRFPLNTLPLVVLFSVPALAQNPREPQQLDSGTTAPPSYTPKVDSAKDLTAVVFKDSNNHIFVTVSTGQGKNYSSPARIDDDATGANKYLSEKALKVCGDNIYVVWRDERNGSDDDVYFTVSTDGGNTWLPNVRIDKGFPAGQAPVRGVRMDCNNDNIAIVVCVEDPTTGDEEVKLITSPDAGSSFRPPVDASPQNGLSDHDEIDVKVGDNNEGNIVIVTDVLGINTVLDTVFDAGSGLITALGTGISTLANSLGKKATGGDAVIDDEDGQDDLGMHVVAAAWLMDDAPGGGPDELWVNVSLDGGVTWLGDQQIGGYLAGIDDVDSPDILVRADGTILVTWEDNRSGLDEIYVAVSTDFGFTWLESQVSVSGGGFPQLAGNDDDYVAITFTGRGFPEIPEMAYSRDGGITWNVGVNVGGGMTGDADYHEIAYNNLYDNFICIWLSDDFGINNLYAGGMRCQTLSPVGVFTAGAPVSFLVREFGISEAGGAFQVVVSSVPGNIVIPGDGRDTGLGSSNLLVQSSNSPALAGQISGIGDGSTATVNFPSTIPVGTILHCIAVSHSGGSFFSITDVVTVPVQ